MYVLLDDVGGEVKSKGDPLFDGGDLDMYLKVGEIAELMDEKGMFLMNGVSKERGSTINLDRFCAS